MSNPVTQEYQAIAAEQDAQEARPSAREHYEFEAALAEPINALEAVMRTCHPLLPGSGRDASLTERLDAIAHAREVLKRWGKV